MHVEVAHLGVAKNPKAKAQALDDFLQSANASKISKDLAKSYTKVSNKIDDIGFDLDRLGLKAYSGVHMSAISNDEYFACW